MKPINNKSSSYYIDFDIENNDRDPKLPDMWEYQNIKNIFCKRLHSKLIRRSLHCTTDICNWKL